MKNNASLTPEKKIEFVAYLYFSILYIYITYAYIHTHI